MPMPAQRFGNVVLALVTAAAFALATVVVAAPAVKPKAMPADESATPAIDPAKLAGSADLRAAAERNLYASQTNLKQLVLAVHNYADGHGLALPGSVLGKDGKPLLSWRVQLLPYLEEGELYKKFKLDEPWDSKHNLALLDKMPKVLASPRVKLKQKGFTVYQVFSGPGALYQKGIARLNLLVPDGTSNTIFAVEASTAVPWTKPVDLAFNKDKALPDFGKAYGKRPLAALLDGSTRVLDLNTLSATTLKHAIMPDDGNPLGSDW
jgi:hypothetical protein